MATTFSRMSKWLLIGGGALVALSLIITLAIKTTDGGTVSAQATPVRTATPGAAAPAGAATPVRTATPAAPAAVATPVRTATPAVAVATPIRTATPARIATVAPAPGALPANGDSVTFPALLVALVGAGLVGLGLFARYSMGKSKA